MRALSSRTWRLEKDGWVPLGLGSRIFWSCHKSSNRDRHLAALERGQRPIEIFYNLDECFNMWLIQALFLLGWNSGLGTDVWRGSEAMVGQWDPRTPGGPPKTSQCQRPNTLFYIQFSRKDNPFSFEGPRLGLIWLVAVQSVFMLIITAN